jgi:hypothetical protein
MEGSKLNTMDGNTKKKKVIDAINRISQDVLPTQIDYTPEMKVENKLENLISSDSLRIGIYRILKFTIGKFFH